MSNETCNCPCCQQGIAAPHEYHLERRAMPTIGNDLDPQTALDYARRMKAYCEAFNGRDWASVMLHGSPDEQNLAHALDNLTECAAMLMNMAGRVAAGGVPVCAAPRESSIQRDTREIAETFARAPLFGVEVRGERIPCSRCTSEIWCEMHGCKQPAADGVQVSDKEADRG